MEHSDEHLHRSLSGELVVLVHTRPMWAAGAPLVLDYEDIIRHPRSILLNCVALVGCLKLVESDVVFIDAHAFQHGASGLDHRLRAAEVVFQRGGVFVLAEVLAVEHFVDETGVRGPVVLWQGFGEGDVELEVGKLPREVLEVVLIENLLP